MIALRPIHGNFGPMKIHIKEGRKIPEQILKYLDVKELLKTKQIKEEKEDKKENVKVSKKGGERGSF